MFAAALLLIAIGIAHSYLGEKYILIRLLKRDVPPIFGSDDFTRKTLRFAWHATTIAWWGFAALLFSKFSTIQISLQIVSATFMLSSLIAIIGSKGRHLSWIVFGAIAALTWLASNGAV